MTLPDRPAWATIVGRRALLGLIAAGAVSSLPGCRTESTCDDGEPQFTGTGEIVFAAPPDFSLGRRREQAVARWNDENPGWAARYVPLPVPADLQRAELLTKLQAGQSDYDVLGLDVVWTAEFARGCYIMSLDSVADRLGIDRFMEPALSTARYKERLWAVPLHSNAGLLYYRTDLVESPPNRWSDLPGLLGQVDREEGVDGYIGQLAHYEGLTVNVSEAVWGHGGALVDDGRVVADRSAAIGAMEFLVRGVEEGWIPRAALAYTEERCRERFQEGGAVFMRNWPYAYEILKSEESAVRDRFGVVQLPGPSALGGMNLAISRFSRRKETALEFIRFLTGNETQREVHIRGAYPAAINSVYEEPAVQAALPYTAELADSLRSARSRPVTPYYGQVTAAIQGAAHPAIRDGREPAHVMRQLANDLEVGLRGETNP
jgi:multiple sugar transport system substrate-binding protein